MNVTTVTENSLIIMGFCRGISAGDVLLSRPRRAPKAAASKRRISQLPVSFLLLKNRVNL